MKTPPRPDGSYRVGWCGTVCRMQTIINDVVQWATHLIGAWGLPAVFFLMGVLMVGASYFAQTGALSWTPLIASLPVSCLVAAILHGNDLRDTVTDRAASIQTTTLIVGDRAAQTLFYALHLAPYLVVATSVAVGALPAWSLLTLLASPLTFGAITACAGGFRARDAVRIGKLEGLSAGTHFIFGALLVLGLVLAHLL